MSSFSGQGFKFSPLLGLALADVIASRCTSEYLGFAEKREKGRCISAG
ncbi:hypothetical protein RintRC_6157 [Richelia intracellularis]|nr:hypothetical protein RintRC_6157 [Richelia intracellularis]